ncbi:MAG: hypothetical protein QM736_00530 [Vicinamibacterales bacterium]
MRAPFTRCLVATIALLCPVPLAAQVQSILSVPAMPLELRADASRFARLERWALAVAHHNPGEPDGDSADLATWSLTDLQALWIDANALARVMRDRSAGGFRLGTPDGRSTSIVYTRAQLDSLRRLACIVGGYLDPSGFAMRAGSVARECVESIPLNELSPALADVAVSFGHERVRRGDDNLFWKRGALLHSDIAMLEHQAPVPLGTPSLPIGPRRARLELIDGRAVGLTLGGIHWSLAESLLTFVKPADAHTPAPERDDMVRAWYQATTLWMQSTEQHDLQHLENGLALFPDDATLTFLSGCEHETYSAASIQAAINPSNRATNAVRSAKNELKRAAADLRRSLGADSSNPQTHMHLGHVLSMLDEPREAIDHLTAASTTLDSDELHYLNDLFLGRALEQAARFDEARAAYQRAHDRRPTAQSPMLALSALARRRDAYEPARAAIDSLWTTPATDDDDNPWWTYPVSHTAGVDAVVARAWELGK